MQWYGTNHHPLQIPVELITADMLAQREGENDISCVWKITKEGAALTSTEEKSETDKWPQGFIHPQTKKKALNIFNNHSHSLILDHTPHNASSSWPAFRCSLQNSSYYINYCQEKWHSFPSCFIFASQWAEGFIVTTMLFIHSRHSSLVDCTINCQAKCVRCAEVETDWSACVY